jgi:hypothetical protein
MSKEKLLLQRKAKVLGSKAKATHSFAIVTTRPDDQCRELASANGGFLESLPSLLDPNRPKPIPESGHSAQRALVERRKP